CEKEEPSVENDKNQILSFSFNELPVPIRADVDTALRLITARVPAQLDLTKLVPTIEVSPNATISPRSGVPTDFSKETIYKVFSKSGRIANYFVQLTKVDDLNSISSFTLPDLFQTGQISGTTISFRLPFGTDLSAVKVQFDKPKDSTTPFNPGDIVNLANTRQFTVTSAFGTPKTYTIDITIEPQETGIRGVWLTNVASDVLTSRKKIADAMQLLSDLNFNTVFVVTWNKTATPYYSKVLEEAIAPLNDPNIQTHFYNDGRDILKEVIEEAHARGLKVIAWFEYGFAAQYGSANGGRNAVLQAHPEWESRDQNGKIANKNDFYWMNAFHPDVQKFMTDLVLEVVKNYDIDGIQGDDRLPAVSSSSGYDDYTVNLYKSQHNGQAPPVGEQNQSWVQWRSNILNAYAVDLYRKVKAVKPNCLVTYSPSPYSFSFFNYCQDWPAWVRDNVVEAVSPQLYRRDDQGISVYQSLLSTNLNHAQNKTKIFFPGVLLMLGSYLPSDDFLVQMIRANRARGVTGEVYFFYEGVPRKQKVFKAMYPGKAKFPS
ncbi:MAG: family 10 glycosylhydrolase, partial [Saprospiraceae bacterium]